MKMEYQIRVLLVIYNLKEDMIASEFKMQHIYVTSSKSAAHEPATALSKSKDMTERQAEPLDTRP